MADMALTTHAPRPRRAMRSTRLAALALLTALSACRGNTYAPPPPPEVTVVQPVQQEVTTYS